MKDQSKKLPFGRGGGEKSLTWIFCTLTCTFYFCVHFKIITVLSFLQVMKCIVIALEGAVDGDQLIKTLAQNKYRLVCDMCRAILSRSAQERRAFITRPVNVQIIGSLPGASGISSRFTAWGSSSTFSSPSTQPHSLFVSFQYFATSAQYF